MKILSYLILLMFGLISTPLHAENSKALGDFIVHFNALSTESLPPKVAQAYGIIRSKNRGLLNVSVVRKDGLAGGVEADIKVRATNLTGQLRNIELRKIQEQDAIYYISDFNVADRETLDFFITVTTADQQTGNMSLRQQFFAN